MLDCNVSHCTYYHGHGVAVMQCRGLLSPEKLKQKQEEDVVVEEEEKEELKSEVVTVCET